MIHPNDLPKYRWPDLSAVERQYLVLDDLGRYGIATADPVYHPGVLFAHPADMPASYEADIPGVGAAIMLTDTPFHLKAAGHYAGTWCDYNGPTSPATVPPELIRYLTIVEDLGWYMPGKWADQALAGSEDGGHWNYGARLGKVGGEPPVKGMLSAEMTVPQAVTFAKEAGETATAVGIRKAARSGYIPGARRVGRDWLIPYKGFDYYLDHRPRPGRKAGAK